MMQIIVRARTILFDQYKILIGYDVLESFVKKIRDSQIANQYLIISDDTVSKMYGNKLLQLLKDLNLSSSLIDFPAGEQSKSFETTLRLSETMLQQGADRKSGVIALGGGVTGDLAGFIASIYMRGIPFIQIPTTLMAQVDSSIGGKTGVNLPAGKNLLGTFHQPEMVLTDVKFLESLPEKEYNNGLSEVLKYGAIEGETIFAKLENNVDEIRARNLPLLKEIIESACSIKAKIVSQDETEKNLRRVLNFGHTIGHAVEAASGYDFSHGECVAVGMVAAARLSERISGLASEEVRRIEQLITALGLKRKIPPEISTEAILSASRHDKKREGEGINFVALRRIGSPIFVKGLDEQVIRETIDSLRE